MRKLVTIQTIKELIPIANSDRIELAKVMGWKAIVKKDEFKVGDKCIYFEVDSFLPVEERYEFLRSSSYKNNEIMGEGFRIKTQKMRGELSQGLIIPLSVYPELPQLENMSEGENITELLNVKKWDMPEIQGDIGTIIGSMPFGIPKTDEIRIQSAEDLIEKLKGKKYYISTKMDGSSCTVYVKDKKVGVCSRSSELRNDEKSSMWKYVKNSKLDEELISLGRNLAIQGEFCGHGIQNNRLKLFNPKLFIFNIYDIDSGRYLNLEEVKEITDKINQETVPIEEIGNDFDYNLEELLERAKGKYPSGLDKEGIVIRSLDMKISFKVINNDFLSKEK